MPKKNNEPAPPLKICIVTADLMGYGQPTDVSASVSALAQHHARGGHNVTLVWVPSDFITDEELIERQVAYYRQQHLVDIVALRHSEDMLPGLSTPELRSAAVYHYIRDTPFDVVYFSLEGGLGYFSLLAREMGLLDEPPKLVVFTQSPLMWFSKADRFFLEKIWQVAIAHMERYCVERADLLWCASQSLVDWMRSQDWKLAAEIDVQPPLLPDEWVARPTESGDPERPAPSRELVLLAGPSFRDGLTLFCDAMDKLAAAGETDLSITAFGPFAQILGEHTGGLLLRRANRWPFELRIFPNKGFRERIEYAARRNAVAVIPAFDSATAYSVRSCISNGIRFVTTGSGANGEAARLAGLAHRVAGVNAADLAERIGSSLSEKVDRTRNAPSVDEYSLLAGQLARISSPKKPARKPRKRKSVKPFVSIVMVHYDRPNYVQQAIEAVEKQDYEKFELILVDDGSRLPESRQLLDRLEPKFKKKKWKIIRQKNQYLGAARNTGIRAAKGDRILFVDDDNALFENAVSTYVHAMEASGADVCTAFHRTFYGDTVPRSKEQGFLKYVAIGGSLDMGIVYDSFGDANAMIRRSVVKKIGYQVEDYGYTAHDWEYFLRSVLSGLKLRIIPEPLFWYRGSASGMHRNSHWYDNRLPILETFRKHDFKGLDLIYHLAVSANMLESELLGYRENLRYSASDERYLQLCEIEENSTEAIYLMAQIAASEGRPETAMSLVGWLRQVDFHGSLKNILSIDSYAEMAAAEVATGFLDQKWFDYRALQTAEISADPPSDSDVLTYLEEPDRLFVQARESQTAIAVLPSGCPREAIELFVTAHLDQEPSPAAEIRLMLVDFHVDPFVAVRGEKDAYSEIDSGWSVLEQPYLRVELTDKLPIPSSRSLNIVLAVRQVDQTSRPTLVCFSNILVRMAKGDRSSRRPRLGAPAYRQRSRALWNEERASAKLTTGYKSELPLLLIDPNDSSIFLRPHKSGPVVATLRWAFPSFARRLVASVEIAHEEASPFEFAIALTQPTRPLNWKRGKPAGHVAFSGWQPVEKPFTLHDVEVAVETLSKTKLDVHLAIRLPAKSSDTPANAFWRKMMVFWDD